MEKMPDDSHHPASRRGSRWRFGFFLAGAAFLLFCLFVPPAIPIFRHGDQGIYLANAARMLNGQAPYRDFFDIMTPGTDLVYFLIFKCVGLRAWVPNLVLWVLGLGLFGTSVQISRSLMTGVVAYLPGFLFLTVGYRFGLDATHHWFSVLCAMQALAVLLPERTRGRIFLAGGLCGLAADFTPLRGPIILAFALFLVWDAPRSARRAVKRVAVLAGGFVGAIVAFNAYFVWKAGFARFLYCTVEFVYKYFRLDPSNTLRAYLMTFPAWIGWQSVPKLVMFFALQGVLFGAYAWFFHRHRRFDDKRDPDLRNRTALVAVVGLAMLLDVAASPSWLRLTTALLPAAVLFIFLLRSASNGSRGALRVVVLAVSCLALAEPLQMQFRAKRILDLPSGEVAFTSGAMSCEASWLSRHTRASEYVFGDPDWTMFFHFQDPAPTLFVTSNGYTRPWQVLGVIRGLEKYRAPFVLWPMDLDPAGRANDPLAPLRFYLAEHYHRAKSFDHYEEVWERNP